MKTITLKITHVHINIYSKTRPAYKLPFLKMALAGLRNMGALGHVLQIAYILDSAKS